MQTARQTQITDHNKRSLLMTAAVAWSPLHWELQLQGYDTAHTHTHARHLHLQPPPPFYL